MSRSRSIAIDVARGIAVVLMIQTHAYDGFVAQAERASLAFRGTRFLAVFPLPTFLVLAGVGIAMRLRAGESRREAPGRVRAEVARRGLEIVAVGYLLNVGLGLIDGADRIATYLRVDVLHAIGLSILCTAPFIARRDRYLGRIELAAVGAIVFALMAGGTIPLTYLGRATHGPIGYVAGLFVEVPGVTRMPLVPLAGFFGVGLTLGAIAIDEARARSRYALLAVVAIVVAGAAVVATETTLALLPGTFDRTHPAIVWNLIELAARAVALVLIVLALDPPAKVAPSRALALVGRHSMLAYAFHLPFVYGRIPRPIARGLDMPGATLALAVVLSLTFAAVVAQERRTRSSSPETSA